MLLSMNEYELTILGFAIGMFIAPMLTTNQQNSLGNFFELIGQTLLTVNAQTINLQPAAPSRLELLQKINILEKEIDNLKKSLY